MGQRERGARINRIRIEHVDIKVEQLDACLLLLILLCALDVRIDYRPGDGVERALTPERRPIKVVERKLRSKCFHVLSYFSSPKQRYVIFSLLFQKSRLKTKVFFTNTAQGLNRPKFI